MRADRVIDYDTDLEQLINAQLGKLLAITKFTQNRAYEVEMRLLEEGKSGYKEKFDKVLAWMQENHDPVMGHTHNRFTEHRWKHRESHEGLGYFLQVVQRDGSKYLKCKQMAIRLPEKCGISTRVGVSFETELKAYNDPKTQPSRVDRERWSFNVSHKTAVGTIDITINTIDKNVTYDIEIEIASNTIRVNPRNTRQRLTITEDQMRFFKHWSDILIGVMLTAGQNLDSRTITQTKSEFEKALNMKRPICINRPKDIFKQDLSSLIPRNSRAHMKLSNPDFSPSEIDEDLHGEGYSQPLMSIEGGYICSLKAHGIRRLVFMSTLGVFLIDGMSGEMFRISEISIMPGTILDAEIIDAERDEIQILVFDVLSIPGLDVKKEAYTNRIRYAEMPLDMLRAIPGIKAELKPYVRLYPEDFFDKVQKMYKELSKGSHQTGDIVWTNDGLIFTPAERPYDEITDLYKQNKPYDTNYSLVRKWKPPSELTIDFLVNRDPIKGLVLETAKTKTHSDHIFKGTERFPWNGKVQIDESMINKIYEFRWDGNMFVAVRQRLDKTVPNAYNTARSVWSLINDPITPEIIQGKTLTFMRSYHNKIKRLLLTELSKLSSNKVHLDIGSGAGGDLSKIQDFTKVYLVEPDMKNLEQLIRRSRGIQAASSDLDRRNGNVREQLFRKSITKPVDPKNVIINAGVEELDYIKSYMTEKVDTISMFNVLTFLYKDLDSVMSVIHTVSSVLNKNGHFYVIVFDGELALQQMNGKTTIKTENITMSRPNPCSRELYIKIKGGIVRGQTEYLVQTREFVVLMDNAGFTLEEEYYLTDEKLLSKEEAWFSSMFKVMKFIFSSNPNKTEIAQDSNNFLQIMKKNLLLRPLDDTESPMRMNPLEGISKLKLVRFGVIGDGSCYVHACLKAFSKEYQTSMSDKRVSIAKNIRMDIADTITEEEFEQTKEWFEGAGFGNLDIEDFKQVMADPTRWIGQYLIPYVNRAFQINVFILSGVNPEPYVFGQTSDKINSKLDSVVLYYINDNHYETVGVDEKEGIRTLFDFNHPLIKHLSK